MNSQIPIINFFINNNITALTINDYPVITVAWNIFLLLIPFFIGKKLISIWRKTKFKGAKSKIVGITLFCFWLLFAPNAAYVMTDVRHISGFCPNNYDRICIDNAWMIFFFFTYGIIGWIAFVYLINQMKYLINKLWGKLGVLVYLWLISPIIALGVLLGLVNRWNSWDIVFYPQEIINGALLYLNDWTYLKNLVIYTLFLYLLYFIGDNLFVEKFKFKK